MLNGIHTVETHHTPNQGRAIWNANDVELLASLKGLAINVRAMPYMAPNDGLTNAQSAIQSAIDDCTNQGGGIVWIPSGTYLIQDLPILLRDSVQLIGAGVENTSLKLAANAGHSILCDETILNQSGYAFGRVRIANLSFDGNSENVSASVDAIHTSAYFSIFENLHIYNCSGSGIHMSIENIQNFVSQNHIHACRISNCGFAAIHSDIHSVDHIITHNFLSDCNYGIYNENGGVQIICNKLFGHQYAAVYITQTSQAVMISQNDMNANANHAIHLTRTTHSNSGPWGQMLIEGNSILGDYLEADNRADAIHIETDIPQGLSNLSIIGNKIFTLDQAKGFRYGINFERNITNSKCIANHIQGAVTADYHIDDSCSDIMIDPPLRIEHSIRQPAIPISGESIKNPFPSDVTVYIKGRNIQSVLINGFDTGMQTGAFYLRYEQKIQINYLEIPDWMWIL